jgi:hypothetical protein
MMTKTSVLTALVAVMLSASPAFATSGEYKNMGHADQV